MPRVEGQDGSVAKVTEEGRLQTEAIALSEDHVAALGGDAYTIDIDAVGVDAGDHLIALKNNDDDSLIVTSMVLWVTEYKDTCRLEVNLNETWVYAANGTEVVPVNLKSGISGGASVTCYKIASAGTDITTFGGTAAKAGRRSFNIYPEKWVKESGWIIPKGQVFSLEEDAGSGGNTYRGYISFYIHRSCSI